MKNSIFCVLLLFSIFSSNAEILKHYDQNNLANAVAGYTEYIARMEPTGTGKITELGIWLNGNDLNGTAVISLYGHEGGTSFPQFEKDLIKPITIFKTKIGPEKILVVLPEAVITRNNQFFIAVKNLSSGTFLMCENSPATYTCTGTDGGTYYYSFFKSGNQWFNGNRKSFAVEATIIYDAKIPAKFTDVTDSLQLPFNILGSSIAWCDIDYDGFQDLLAGGRLFRNEKGKKFTEITNNVGLRGKPTASAFVDINMDGFADILFLGVGDSNFVFIRDIENKYTANYLPEIPPLKSISGLAVGDVTNDGLPDILVTQLWGIYPVPMPDYLFKNIGNCHFSDITKVLYPTHNGIDNFPNAVACDPANNTTWLSDNNKNKRSRGCSMVDYDNDGDLDIFISRYFLEQDGCYRNNGDGTFTDLARDCGIDVNKTSSNHGTGVDWFDYDADGDMDLLLPQFAHPAFNRQYDHRTTTIYRNDGPNGFYDTWKENGIEFEETYAGGTWGDLNNDGLADFVISAFYSCRFLKVYLQQPDHSFLLSTFDYEIEKLSSGEDLLLVDFDNDGKLDLITTNQNYIRIYRNTDNEAGNFVKIQFCNANGKPSSSIGAKVQVFANGNRQLFQLTPSHGIKMQKPLLVHAGLANAPYADSIIVSNSTTGFRKVFINVPANTLLMSPEATENKIPELISFPNPSNPDGLWLSFDGLQIVSIFVSDESGKLITTLADNVNYQTKEVNYFWNLTNANGNRVANGLYYISIQTGTSQNTIKVLVR